MSNDGIGTVRVKENAVGVKVHGGWTVVWTLFTDGTSGRGYFYPDGNQHAEWIAGGELAVSANHRFRSAVRGIEP